MGKGEIKLRKAEEDYEDERRSVNKQCSDSKGVFYPHQFYMILT